MSSSSARRTRGTGRVLWGRIGVAVCALLLAFVLGRCSVEEGVAVAEYQAAQARISELEQRALDLEQSQVALAAGGVEVTPTPTPEPSPAEEPPADEQAPAPEPTPTVEGSQYTVQEGDTLETIAERVYGDRSQFTRIQEANGVESTNLQVGQTLVIPPPAQEG